MDEGATDIYIAAAAPEQAGDHAVHHYSDGSNGDHRSWAHVHRIPQTFQSFIADECGNRDQRKRIHECGEYACTVVSNGLGGTRGTGLEIECYPREQQG